MGSSAPSLGQRPNSSTALRRRPCESQQHSSMAISNRLSWIQRHQRTWTIALFSITTLLLFSDQNLMSPSLTAIAEEFGMNDEDRDRKLGGDISLAFFLLGAPASMVIGCLTDTHDRSVVFAWTVFIGEGACFANFFVQNYQQLYVCRAITGFSVGGAIPLIYSVLGDLYPAEERHIVSALVSFGTGAGIAVGQAVAGFLGPVFGWRLPFLVVSVPALVAAALVLFTVPDPERGAMEPSMTDASEGESEVGVALVAIKTSQHEYRELSPPPTRRGDSSSSSEHSEDFVRNENQVVDEYFDITGLEQHANGCGPEMRVHFRAMVKLISTPTVLLAIVQGAPGCITWGIINVFLNDFLSENRGFTVQMATTTLMFFSLGNGLGLFLLGGGVGQQLYRFDKRYPAILAGASAIGGCMPLWMLFNKVDVNTAYSLVICISMLAGFGSGPTGPIVKATLTNVTHPKARGQAFAFFNLFDDFGKGLGPFFVSLLITSLGRQTAFNVGILGFLICGVANLAVFFFVERDESNLQAQLLLEARERGMSV